MRTQTRFCPKGHDKDAVGRTKKKGCAECARIYALGYRADNYLIVRVIELRSKRKHILGLPEDEGVQCEICGTPPVDRLLDADHNHSTNEFRGWLCRQCNLLIGNSKENPDVLLSAIRYLSRHQ